MYNPPPYTTPHPHHHIHTDASTTPTNMDRAQLVELLKNNKNLSDSTLRTYASLLVNFAQRLGTTDVDTFFDQSDHCIETLNERYTSPQTRKTILSALYILTGHASYKSEMTGTIAQVNQMYRERRLEGKRLSTRISFQAVREIVESYERECRARPTPVSITEYLLAAICSGYYGNEGCPPRRLLEWALLKWTGDKATENVVDWRKNTFVLNIYKTAHSIERRTGSTTQTVVIPKALRPWMKQLQRMHLSEYVFVNRAGRPYNSSTLSKRLTAIFNFSADQLRSVYVTDELYADNLMKRLETQAELMGHSVQSQRDYYLKDNNREENADADA